MLMDAIADVVLLLTSFIVSLMVARATMEALFKMTQIQGAAAPRTPRD
jgi:hypothetical protein